MKSFQILATVAAAAMASAKTIRIDSGPMLEFKPDNIMAEAGDMLEFHFYARNHSVAQGDFASACQPVKTAGFFSGYVPVMGTSESESVFTVKVNDTKPIWFYCTQGQHCKGGMVGVVNAPQGKTLDMYKTAAAATNGPAGAAVMAFGGTMAMAGSANATEGSGSDGKMNSADGGVRATSAGVLAAMAGLVVLMM
ncbi:GPI-anchored cupredoxin [Apiospora phragmitis]|uniref:GPI-anchored cupredoxin n=1 Tax=Apiospora phragmitis TaxID=2905665 RepID=A0ABR1VFK1_9PEZI